MKIEEGGETRGCAQRVRRNPDETLGERGAQSNNKAATAPHGDAQYSAASYNTGRRRHCTAEPHLPHMHSDTAEGTRQPSTVEPRLPHMHSNTTEVSSLTSHTCTLPEAPPANRNTPSEVTAAQCRRSGAAHLKCAWSCAAQQQPPVQHAARGNATDGRSGHRAATMRVAQHAHNTLARVRELVSTHE